MNVLPSWLQRTRKQPSVVLVTIRVRSHMTVAPEQPSVQSSLTLPRLSFTYLYTCRDLCGFLCMHPSNCTRLSNWRVELVAVLVEHSNTGTQYRVWELVQLLCV
eukprot:m.167800 g.167800  ORF g.167800 m.167800 type:complete len:104 (+) comp14467_c0_seq7:1766-2077(+)